jgi:uncharacterized damage-inducible protein DinB
MTPVSAPQAGNCSCTNGCEEIAAVAHAAAALLEQCQRFIAGLPSGGLQAYAAASERMPGGTIGKHIRHSLDHFRAALEGAESGAAIDYDHRARDVPMETLPEAASEAIRALCARLEGLDGAALSRPVRVRVMLTGDGAEAELTSTLARELAFATHHAVHHHAMIGVIAGEFGHAVPPGFGKAPSTINYDRSRA